MENFLDTFYQRLSDIELLTPGEEEELWRLFKEEGDEEAREELIVRYQPLVVRIIGKLKPVEELFLDLYEEGVIGLIEAVDRFEPGRGFLFSTYATFRIKGRALTFLQKMSKAPQTLEEPEQLALLIQREEGHRTENPDERAEKLFLLEKIQARLPELPGKEREVFMRVVLGEEKPKHVCVDMGISRSYLSRLKDRAWDRLKNMMEEHR